MAISPSEGRFEPYLLEPGAPSAFACFGTWENIKTCQVIASVDDALDGCSQSVECRRYTLEQNPPTTRFRVKPRRDGRFEIQQFRDFIRDQVSYHMEIAQGCITITYPGKRNVPKSKRFFLHVKHLDQAGLSVEGEFELIMSLERMLLRRASAGRPTAEAPRPRLAEEDPEARRRRIAEKLRKKASESARSTDDDDEDLDIDIDIDIDDDDDDDSEIEIDTSDGDDGGSDASGGEDDSGGVDDSGDVDDGLVELDASDLKGEEEDR
ncbi:MAG: hypothetical protein CSA66_00300 [Proteobacteria bacterium]|nr:MAG: hypothetical protein CSA66_00300 [Pseudomonadota bacterium]